MAIAKLRVAARIVLMQVKAMRATRHYRCADRIIAMALDDPLFWTALLKIIGVNIVLSGDNAVVIALAARSLQGKQQKQAIIWGSGAAIVMRVILTLFAVALLE